MSIHSCGSEVWRDAGVLKAKGETARYKRKRLYARREVCSGTPDDDELRQIESYGLNFVSEDLKRDTVLQQVTADVDSQGGAARASHTVRCV